jgi:hypothetical protein
MYLHMYAYAKAHFTLVPSYNYYNRFYVSITTQQNTDVKDASV